LKIVTYNMQWGKGRDGRIDLGRIAATVAGADVIALQEVERHWRPQDFPDQAARLSELLPDHDWVYGAAVSLAGATPQRRRQLGNMILSRWPISSTRTLPLPARPVFGHMNDEQSMTEAVIDAEGFALRLYNTHLNYLDAGQRLDQLARLMAFIAEAPGRGGPVTAPGKSGPGPEDDWIVLPDGRLPPMPAPAILMGDFNFTPGSPEYRILASSFADALAVAGGDPFTVTFPGGSEPPQRLDYIFLTPDIRPRLRSCHVDQDADGSDHQPVWAEIS
jgi:endonuclease/exonuclease/phosphatase family metal-dependent hydrolase